MQQNNGVVTVARDVDAPVQAVWDVLADGWAYATWVVGASRVREVDSGWPADGARIHHSFGVWPALVNDTTEVLRSSEPTELVLTARGWPTGEAKVVISIAPLGDQACTVRIEEDATSGPATAVPKPVRQLAIGLRNVEALKRLAYLAQGRHRERGATASASAPDDARRP